MKSYIIQQAPFVVPTTDGKLIEEHFGNATDGNQKISIALTSPFSRTFSKKSSSRSPEIPSIKSGSQNLFSHFNGCLGGLGVFVSDMNFENFSVLVQLVS